MHFTRTFISVVGLATAVLASPTLQKRTEPNWSNLLTVGTKYAGLLGQNFGLIAIPSVRMIWC